jgi:DNA-binding transcriptional LysR family regulator
MMFAYAINSIYLETPRHMDLYVLQVFRAVATEKSFSRAAVKLGRTQPAISLAVQRLEAQVGESLIDRAGKELRLTDAGGLVLDYARRFANLGEELGVALAELRDNAAGRLTVGANESTTLYLLPHLARYRRRYPRVKLQVRRSQSSRIPMELLEGDLELGVISYAPQDPRLISRVIYTDHLAFIVSPQHRLARRKSVSIAELGMETFIAHNVVSPYREVVLREFQRLKVPLNRDVEIEGVAFLPRMCVNQELEQGVLREVQVKELKVERKIHLVHPAHRTLSHAAKAFLALLE